MEFTSDQMTLSLEQAQALYVEQGGVEQGTTIDVFKTKRWLKCAKGLILAAWEEQDGEVTDFRAVVKEAKVTPVVVNPTQDHIDYPMLAGMTAVGGGNFGMGYAVTDAIFKAYEEGRRRRLNG